MKTFFFQLGRTIRVIKASSMESAERRLAAQKLVGYQLISIMPPYHQEWVIALNEGAKEESPVLQHEA